MHSGGMILQSHMSTWRWSNLTSSIRIWFRFIFDCLTANVCIYGYLFHAALYSSQKTWYISTACSSCSSDDDQIWILSFCAIFHFQMHGEKPKSMLIKYKYWIYSKGTSVCKSYILWKHRDTHLLAIGSRYKRIDPAKISTRSNIHAQRY